MNERPAQPSVKEFFFIKGQVGSKVFPLWISRHAARLGLEGQILDQSLTQIEVMLAGPADLLDAMALACSLGPQEVWVDEIERLSGNCARPDESCSDSA